MVRKRSLKINNKKCKKGVSQRLKNDGRRMPQPSIAVRSRTRAVFSQADMLNSVSLATSGIQSRPWISPYSSFILKETFGTPAFFIYITSYLFELTTSSN